MEGNHAQNRQVGHRFHLKAVRQSVILAFQQIGQADAQEQASKNTDNDKQNRLRHIGAARRPRGIGDGDIGRAVAGVDVRSLQLGVEQVIQVAAGAGLRHENAQLHDIIVHLAGHELLRFEGGAQSLFVLLRQDEIVLRPLFDLPHLALHLLLNRLHLIGEVRQTGIFGAILGFRTGIRYPRRRLLLAQ